MFSRHLQGAMIATTNCNWVKFVLRTNERASVRVHVNRLPFNVCVTIRAERTLHFVYRNVFLFFSLNGKCVVELSPPHPEISKAFKSSNHQREMSTTCRVVEVENIEINSIIVWFDLILLLLNLSSGHFCIVFANADSVSHFHQCICSGSLTKSTLNSFRCNRQTESIWFNSTYVDFLCSLLYSFGRAIKIIFNIYWAFPTRILVIDSRNNQLFFFFLIHSCLPLLLLLLVLLLIRSP